MDTDDELTLRAQRMLTDNRKHSPQALAWARMRAELHPLSVTAKLVVAVRRRRPSRAERLSMRGFTERELSLGAQREW